jgi:GR25 family glycosyltransferase involved in LPS biosynthesis
MQQPDFNYTVDDSLNINYDRTKQIAETLIISILNNENSIMCATRAINSCRKVGQPDPKLFWGYDGTDKKTIKTPEHLKNSDAMRLIKVMDTSLSITEVSCFLSHIAAWLHCIKINRPVVILEHDSIMVKPFTEMLISNSLEYLGHVGEVASKLKITDPVILEHYLLAGRYSGTDTKYMDIPLTQLINTNYLLVLGLHNYAIDPFMARKLFGYVLKHGLINPADAIIEQHDFTLLQTGIYAVQAPNAEKTSTIDIDKEDYMSNRKYTYSIPGVNICQL